MPSTGTLTDSLRHLGEQFDLETGFYYMRARYYDPAVERFVTRDPYPGNIWKPYSDDPYLYVENSHVNLTDPSGMFPGLDDIEGWIEAGLNATPRQPTHLQRMGKPVT